MTFFNFCFIIFSVNTYFLTKNKNMQNKVLYNTSLIAAGVGIGVLGFFLLTKAQVATTDTTTTGLTLTVPASVSIDDDNVDIAATLDPGVLDSSKKNTLTTRSNNPTGYTVYLSMKDSNGNLGQACLDANSDQLCDAGGTLFDADNGSGATGSYFSVRSAAPSAGTPLSSLPGATFLTTPTNLGSTLVPVFVTTTGVNNAADFEALYNIFTDFTSTVPGSYASNLEYAIVPGI